MIVLLGIITTIYQWRNYKKNIKDFNWSYYKYTELYIKIEKVLSIKIPKRKKFKNFYEKIQKKDFEIQRITPKIPDSILKSYYKKMGNLAPNKNILLGTVNMVEMYLNNPDDYKHIPKASKMFEETEKYVENVRKSSIGNYNTFKFNESTNMKKNYELDRYFYNL